MKMLYFEIALKPCLKQLLHGLKELANRHAFSCFVTNNRTGGLLLYLPELAVSSDMFNICLARYTGLASFDTHCYVGEEG